MISSLGLVSIQFGLQEIIIHFSPHQGTLSKKTAVLSKLISSFKYFIIPPLVA